jgi:hypothetical protein
MRMGNQDEEPTVLPEPWLVDFGKVRAWDIAPDDPILVACLERVRRDFERNGESVSGFSSGI